MANEQEKNLIEILEENNPIDINKYTNYVQSPQCGAIATFYGNTRDTFDGKTVIELRYEAYVPMAIRCLTSICSSARSLWDLNAIAVAHRLGPVSVGETSVFVAVSSVHRVDALDACKFVIDEIKASVPIWKKEVYSNGEVWKENLEFLERRQEVGKDLKRVCCKPKVKVEEEVVAAPLKNGCCRPKVKVDVVAAPVENGCCRPKVKVVEEEEGGCVESCNPNP
ncbi:molybdopterin synthase catalytic subunit [Cynara cardunculus var. scolymus]|uniref:Molybdopterin synthase catalytic subunit n=1 Tax=Cynara cardunculus var. scolymus TaxID=59895 RepID=A0A103Y882_CYNCS|nr:molybdopterin synthase catalytic subunit [Cynara cardunculus var. scolymus]XP_024991633.1 molybdopterin synthase catalytic subunit [Cynara cardunculus var. scolymus]XP_024991634.1 molybdopterin synthase catalytic subunit [Cynara cardunculus var. scolymus]KVI04319.1 Molybdopterin biosynthesis MoaE [Cynara cardunculus var. scolymus]